MDAVRGPDSICPTVDLPAEAQPDVILTRLVETYQTALLRICYMILRDEALAEDAVQETFLKAYKALHTFRGESSEKTWLFRIGVNVCRDMRRGRWFRYIDRRVTPETLPIPAAEAEEEHLDLSRAIHQLKDRDKEIILLYYYQNMNIRDIAQTLDLAPSSVSNRLTKARTHLKNLLERGEHHG